jgi:hypothetical protein
MQPVADHMITTAFALPGYRVVRRLTVRWRSIVGNTFGSLPTLFAGNISIYTQLCELMAGLTATAPRCRWSPRARTPEG